jgi:hypothetical protein
MATGSGRRATSHRSLGSRVNRRAHAARLIGRGDAALSAPTMARSSLSTACKHRLDVAKRLILLVCLHDAWRLGKLGRCDPAMLVRLFGSSALRLRRRPPIRCPPTARCGPPRPRQPTGKAMKFEFLGDGQQFVAADRHPDTGVRLPMVAEGPGSYGRAA